MNDPAATRTRHGLPLLIGALSVVAALAVVLINGAPLFYFDSLGYIDQGTSALRMIVPQGWLEATAPAGGAVGGSGPVVQGPSVNSSRSAVYPVVLAILYHARLLLLVPVVGMVFTTVALWLPMRIALRQTGAAPSLWLLIGLPLLAASAGSYAFYVAYLMPDIFAPVLLMVCATLFAFGPDMRRWEIVLAAVIGLIAIFVHPSHLLIAAGMVPVMLVGAVLVRRRGWWIAPLVIGVLVIFGTGERLLFRSVVKVVTNSEATYYPFLTARLIADGPGLEYLERHCPDATIPTCKLYAALSVSDDPMRLTASNIIFKRGAGLGSFRNMPPEDQNAVAAFEPSFARAVVEEDPVGVITSLLDNTLHQASRYSIEMTIPDSGSISRAERLFPSAGLDHGRLLVNRSWMPVVEAVHTVVYALSLAVIAVLVAWPHRVAWQVRLFALAVLAGILVNAFVCGAISQPAARYGARVIWLLPMLATILVLFAWPATKTPEARR